jgi:hypothetical protein
MKALDFCEHISGGFFDHGEIIWKGDRSEKVWSFRGVANCVEGSIERLRASKKSSV